jgi:hypothetical protein
VEQKPKDHAERRGYRKSPGRQYGYEYEPLQSRGGGEGQHAIPTRSGRLASQESTNYRSEALTQRPDPRRTRQLLRQNILASKVRSSEGSEVPEDSLYEEEEAPRYSSRRQLSQSDEILPARSSLTRGVETYEEEDDLYGNVDPDLGYEEEEDDPLDSRLDADNSHLTGRLSEDGLDYSRLPARASRNIRPSEPVEYDDYDDYDEYEDAVYEGEEAPRKRKKKKGLTRRGLLFGLGAAAIGGGAIAVVELGPKIPQALGNVGNNVEKQVQDAFNKGVAQGAEAARKELLLSLDSLEGVSIDAAMGAARLTRVAYDVFVSPIVKISSQITGDVLNGMLAAFKVGRDWLARINQDNATLAAIQTVLESWVTPVQQLPKQLDAITQADLDGAQAYLRSLNLKIEAEKAKLNTPQATSSPATSSAQPTPKAK